MNRIRMLEHARDQRDHFTRLHREAVSVLPQLEAARDEIIELLDSFDHHRGIQGKISLLLSEYADNVVSANIKVACCKANIEKWSEEAELWALTFAGLKRIWPDVEVFDGRHHEL